MDLSQIPAPFRSLVEQRWQAIGADEQALPRAVLTSLPHVLLWSNFVAERLHISPGWLHGEWARRLPDVMPDGWLRQLVIDATAGVSDERELMTALREARSRLLARVAWRDIVGWASVAETLNATSVIAESCIDIALGHLHAWHREKHGEARDQQGRPQQLVVLGMGKLGGGELNFSSDIDLIFAYSENGESDGPRPLSNEQYFSRLGQKLIRVLDEPTADGFVYRVDMRLRPFGDSGPIVMTFNGVESYYEQHGREWERYAFVKARPVAGDIAAGNELLRSLQPFVYRRYLDYGVFESLREMKAAINREVLRRELRNDVKLGRGGIREAEFVVQLFQLIRGGREARLRERGFHAALTAATELDCIPESDADRLREAYDFLRRLENRLQEEGDRQVHTVPEGSGRERLAFSLGFASAGDFESTWQSHRDQVRRLFDEAFFGPDPRPASDPLENAWQNPRDPKAEAVLAAAGFEDTSFIAESLEQLRARIERHPPGAHGGRQLNKLMPRLLATAGRQEESDLALGRMLKLVEAVLGRTTYLALLLENPRALDQLARICAASEWIAQLVVRHPLLLDELIDPRLFEQVPTRESLQEELAVQLERIDAADLEALMDALREFQQVSVMRIAAADISGVLPLMQVSDRLTDVAELVIQAVLKPAEAHLIARHGEPRYRAGKMQERARFLVVGYGKLGGLELGYGSDLDLVFLHDSRGEDQYTDGARVIDNNLFFLRLTQRLIHFLSTPTAAGVLYQVDTRLRPSGQAGLLVSSMEAFEKYQHEKAWTWEHQALLRARPVGGDTALAGAFDTFRRELLRGARDPERLRAEVAEMRARMRGPSTRTDGLFDLKGGFGGITDIEFLAQYWVLREAHAAPELLEFTDTIRFLEGLESCGRVPGDRLEGLADAYRDLRQSAHTLALQGRPALVSADRHLEARQRVQEVWRMEFGDLDSADPDASR